MAKGDDVAKIDELGDEKEAWVLLVQSCATGLQEKEAASARRPGAAALRRSKWAGLIAAIRGLDVESAREAINAGAAGPSTAGSERARLAIKGSASAYSAWLRAARGLPESEMNKALAMAHLLDEAGAPMMAGAGKSKGVGGAGGSAPEGASLRQQRAACVREWANSSAWHGESGIVAKKCLTELAAKWAADSVESQRLSREDWASAIVASFALDSDKHSSRIRSGSQMMEAFCRKFGEGLRAGEWAEIFAKRSPLVFGAFASTAFIRGAKEALRGKGREIGVGEAGSLMEAACLADDLELLSLAAAASQSAPLRGAPQAWRGGFQPGSLAALALCGDMSRRAWGMWGAGKPRPLRCFEALMRIDAYRMDFEEGCPPEVLAFVGPRLTRQIIERFPLLARQGSDGKGVAHCLCRHFVEALEDGVSGLEYSLFDVSELAYVADDLVDDSDAKGRGLFDVEAFFAREGAELLAEARHEPLAALFGECESGETAWEMLEERISYIVGEYAHGPEVKRAWGKAGALAEALEISAASAKAEKDKAPMRKAARLRM